MTSYLYHDIFWIVCFYILNFYRILTIFILFFKAFFTTLILEQKCIVLHIVLLIFKPVDIENIKYYKFYNFCPQNNELKMFGKVKYKSLIKLRTHNLQINMSCSYPSRYAVRKQFWERK